MRGIAYGVGVGPGDPELMTLKAVKLIRENKIFAFPGKNPKESVAYKIAVKAVPELEDKELISINMPMVHDLEELKRNHIAGAKEIEKYLDRGENVIFLTLGDSTIYCTFTYLQTIMKRDGYETKLINGIPSFCAAAARVNIPLCEWNETLRIVPAVHKLGNELSEPGNYVLMKTGSHMAKVKEMLKDSGKSVNVVENCGMENEQVYSGVSEIPDEAGYFSLIIAKDPKDGIKAVE